MTLSTTVAAFITEVGPPENIQVGELSLPALGPTDVLVKTEAMVVDPVDTYVRAGLGRGPAEFPYIVGRDMVGVVANTGSSGAGGYTVGERVWCNSLGIGGRQGSFAQHVIVPAERLFRLPTGVDPQEAVAVLHGAATAYLGLFGRTRLEPGQTILVGGAGGSVGSCVVQFAHSAGARVIATARADDFDWCRSIGADYVCDYAEPDLSSRLREAAPAGVAIYWDTSGHHDLELATSLLAPGGTIVLMANGRAQPVLPVGPFYNRNANIIGFTLGSASVSELTAAAAMINRQLHSGRLKVRVGIRLPLSDAAKSHRLLEDGFRPGRIVVVP